MQPTHQRLMSAAVHGPFSHAGDQQRAVVLQSPESDRTLQTKKPSVGRHHAFSAHTFSALTLLVGRQERHPACKKLSGAGGAGMVICLERGADLRTAQLMSLPLTVSCFSKIQTGFTFLVPAHPGSLWQSAIKRVFVCMCACVCVGRHQSRCDYSDTDVCCAKPGEPCTCSVTVWEGGGRFA